MTKAKATLLASAICALSPIVAGQALAQPTSAADAASYSLEEVVSSQFSSPFEASTDFLASTKQKAYALGDIDLTYTPASERWTLSGFIRNVADTAVYTQVFRFPFVDRSNPPAYPDGLLIGGLRAPPTFGVRLRVNFESQQVGHTHGI